MSPLPHEPDIAGGPHIDDERAEALFDDVSDRFRNEVANALSGIEINRHFRPGAIRRELFDRISLPENQVRHWAWALSGGGAKGAFQFGAMLYLSRDVRFLPKGIASTSVGSINLVGAAEASMQGFEKLKRNWLEVQNLHDMYSISPWVEDLDRLSTIREYFSVRDTVEGSAPRSLHPDPESVDSDLLGSALRKILRDIPSHLELLAFGLLNTFTAGFWGADVIEDMERMLADLEEAHRIVREEADGVWRFGALREKILMTLDLDAIRRAGTHLRVVMVSLNDTYAYSVDEHLRIYGYTTDRITGRLTRGSAANVDYSIDYDGRLMPSDERVLFTQAILASASIPIANPAIRLRLDTKPRSDYMVDGGLREILPIEQAIEIVETEMGSLPGKKGILSIGAGAANPSPQDYIFAELQPDRFDPDNYQFLDIATTSLGIAIEEILSNEMRVAKERLPEDIEGLVIAPSFLLGETTDIDPGIVQISIAYGWMTAFDKVKQAELDMTPEEYRLRLWLNTNLIAQARYAVWKLEREGTSFYHEHRDVFSELARAILDYEIIETCFGSRHFDRTTVNALNTAILDRVPTGWVFKTESKVGSRTWDIIRQIRLRKRDIKRYITQRVQNWGLESLPNVHDLSNFGADNENCFADWYRYWERHAVQPNTGHPTGPGLIHPEGRLVTPFGRHDSPWDVQNRYRIGEDIETFPLDSAWEEVFSFCPFPRWHHGIERKHDIDPRQVGFDEVAAERPERTWFERDPDYAIVCLEGYVLSPRGEPSEGTVPLNKMYSTSLQDNYTTSRSVEISSYRNVGTFGYVFHPDRDQPPGTIPLYTWYSPLWGDHLTTADYSRFIEGNPLAGGAWTPVPAIDPDYATERLEGYIYPANRPQPEGTLPLYRWISFERRDNYTTTDSEWVPVPS